MNDVAAGASLAGPSSAAPAAAAESFRQAWLAAQCGMIPGAQRGVLLLGAPDAGPFAPAAFWPAGQGPSPQLADVASRTLEARRALVVTGGASAAVTCPLVVDGQLHGLVAIELAAQPEAALQDLVARLHWALYAIEAGLRIAQSRDEQATRERLMTTLDLLASALSEEGFATAAQALATDLAVRLDCDRVSIGFQKDGHAEVVAVSHSAEFGERMNLIRAIGMAMDEALDQRSIVVIPPAGGEPLVTRDHDALARQFGSGSVLSVPFQPSKDQGGAFTFERPAGRPFEAGTIELCQATVALTSRILEARRLNDRGFIVRGRDAWRAQLEKFIGPRYFGRKLAAVTLMALAVFFSFATGNYRVGAQAALEGSVRRVLVAPFDGYVAGAAHRAGDVVKEGAVLATLDQRDLRLEYYRWQSQQSQYARQYQEALAKHDRAQASIVLAQVQQAEAQMNLLAEQLQRTQVAAPFDGLVVSGDLHQSLGASVKRGQTLFEVSPLDAYRIVLEVPEGEIGNVQAGQQGALLLSSLPGEEYAFKVSMVTPVVISKEGRSFFRVEALLERRSERLRPGMEGLAKIEAGRRNLFWIATHRMFDWLRLTLWSWV
jgi:RND family efflux transporter MFP subunit